MRVSRYIPLLLLAASLPAVAIPTHAEDTPRYEAVFADETRLVGEKVSGWGGHPETPRLDGAELLDARRPLRWLRDRTLKAWAPGEHCPGYIEFVGGDRLVGRITGGGAGDGLYVPAHLEVSPATSTNQPVGKSSLRARVLPERIQRVVFGSTGRRGLHPGTLYYRDGRQVGFVEILWKEESVGLLLKNGTSEVKFLDIAEVHFPRIDPWQAYYRELAILAPACRSRMMRIETTGGLIATGSSLRFGASAYGTANRRRSAAVRLGQSGRRLASLEDKGKADKLKLDQARAEYQKQLTESDKQSRAAQQAYHRAVSDMRTRFDGLRKAEAAGLAKRQEEFDRDMRGIEQAMQEWLAKAPVEKHYAILRTFEARQVQLWTSRGKPLAADRPKTEAGWKERTKQLEQFVAAGEQKLQRQATELQNKAAEAKKRLEAQAERFKKSQEVLVSARAQYASIRDGTPETWTHIIQPVWSLDSLRIPFRTIRMRWSYAPQEVPLCRIPPAATVSPPFLPGFTNRSFVGGPLQSGGDEYAWGFAVHAYSELRFPLPGFASAFRSGIGLDNVVGPGGCARARVFVGSSSDKPAYESPLLISSRKTVDTGKVELKPPSDRPGLLVLQADPVDRGAPAGADPLNIRDKLDWLDPRIELARDALLEQVGRRVGPLMAASPGWKLPVDRSGRYIWTTHFDEKTRPGVRCFRTMLRAGSKPLSLRKEMTVGPNDKWLAAYLGLPGGENPRSDVVTLRIDGRQVPPRKIPLRQVWQDRPAPLVFSLDQYKGKKITLELIQPAGGKPLHWQAVSTSSAPPAAYRLVDIMKLVGKEDMKVPYELGSALQSARLGKTEKLAALEVTELGAIVNFMPSISGDVPLDTLANVLVGREWTGGDKAFMKALATFKKMPSLEALLVTEESGVSDASLAKFKTELPDLNVSRFIIRVASPEQGAHIHTTWRNLCKKDVTILWIDQKGVLRFSINRVLTAGQVHHRKAYTGVRYEAHYIREDGARPKDYLLSQPISIHQVTNGKVWDIRPGRKRKP